MKNLTLGILGGLGPISSVWFYEMLTRHTKADCDQKHLNILLSSRADTPDRTAYITGKSDKNPIDTMISEVGKLVSAGAELIAIPCNTAHNFYKAVAESTGVPVLNIIDLCAEYCKFIGAKKVGVLATEGTVLSGAYRNALAAHGIKYITCDTKSQNTITHIIYDDIKRNREPDVDAFLSVADSLTASGADRIILGCTELSLLKRDFRLGTRFVDSLEVLALSAIRLCGKEPTGFDPELMKFIPSMEVELCS